MAKQEYSKIRSALVNRLAQAAGRNASEVSIGHRVATYIGASQTALNSFFSVLNHISPFAEDGLFLAPGKVVNNPTVEELLFAIVGEYQARGYTITA